MRIRSVLVAITVAAVATCLSGGIAVAQVPQNHVTLTGANEVPGPGDSNGKGEFSWSIDGTRLCYLLTAKKISTAVAAHIHKGGTTVSGPVKVTLVPPSNKSSAACVTIASGLASNIKDHPGKYYVNVHNAAFPAGAMRAQLNS